LVGWGSSLPSSSSSDRVMEESWSSSLLPTKILGILTFKFSFF
jgi:hypothetical protein